MSPKPVNVVKKSRLALATLARFAGGVWVIELPAGGNQLSITP
ncbi:MAG: hypothetical protein AABY95_07095 [Pseudomonadota bacterium]